MKRPTDGRAQKTDPVCVTCAGRGYVTDQICNGCGRSAYSQVNGIVFCGRAECFKTLKEIKKWPPVRYGGWSSAGYLPKEEMERRPHETEDAFQERLRYLGYLC